MEEYRIFSDSSCDIPVDELEKYEIETIPYSVSFDKVHYYREIEEISIDEFY